MTNIKIAGASSIVRMPLQSRNPNTIGPLGSFNNSHHSSHEEYNSKDPGTLSRSRLSNLESSNNENNKRLTNSSSHGNLRRDSSHSDVREAAEPQKTPTRSSSVPRPRTPQRLSALPPAAVADEDTVIIEEKRRKVNGEGFTMHRYLRGRLLGKGGFAKVYLCTALDTNKSYAIKIVPKANLVKTRARQKLQAEIKIHRTLKHDHICEYKHFFEDRQNCYILLELCHNYSMNEMIKRRKRLTEPEAAYFGKQLLQAMIYLHENLVIHRDLKLGNLFLDRNMNVKVGDLGLATKLESADEKRKTICGTPNYIAPEVIQGDRATRGHSFEVDIWSMGVILYTCLCGKPPYEAKDVKATYQRILANEYSFPRDVSISDSAKNLIRSMLQSKPTDRPTLDEIAVHPFFSEQFIPLLLPSSVTHVAPVWEENEFGGIAMGSSNNKTTSSKSELSTKPGLPRSNSQRRPFGARDVNVVDRNANPERAERKTTAKQGRDVMAGAVTSALSALAGFGGGAGSNSSSSNKSASAQPAFQVFDETEQEKPKQRSSSHRKSRPVEEDIVSRTAAMTIRTQDASPFHHQSSMNPTPREELATPAANNPENDAYVLHNMIDRIDAVLDVTSRRSYSHVHPESPSLTAFSRGGPTRWVSRYVDYTSKYGLGFLLNDGSSGVYFNDSTKTILEADGESFQYIERKKAAPDSTRRGEPVIASHALSHYPDALQKKVTLLKHFRNYLIEQQKKADEDDSFGEPFSNSPRAAAGHELIYLKKWVRTKHAIFFRLSDHTVQIVFYDHTEVLLTPDERHITYVDKHRVRNTYYLTDELVGCNSEIAKRLKYTKEILQQLISGQPKR